MESNAKWDAFTKLITTFVLAFVVVIIFLSIRNNMAGAGNIISIRFIIFILIVIGTTFLFSIRKYRLTNDSIEIIRVLNTKPVPLSSIKEVRILSDAEIAWTIRLFASGGLFGFIGYFWTSKLKLISVYATRMTRLVLITTTENKKIIISPEDFAFVEALQSKISKHES